MDISVWSLGHAGSAIYSGLMGKTIRSPRQLPDGIEPQHVQILRAGEMMSSVVAIHNPCPLQE